MPQAAGLLFFGTTAGISVGGVALTTAAGALTLAGTAVSIGASLLLSSALTPSAPAARPEDVVQNFSSPVASRQVHMGRVKVGGAMVMPPRASNNKLHILLVQMHGQIEERETHFVDGREVTLDANRVAPFNTPAGADFGYVADDSYQFNGGSRLYLGFRGGVAPSVSFTELLDAFPDWTTEHRLDGLATALIVADAPSAGRFNAMFPNRIPEYACVLRGKRVLDVRTGLTASSENPIIHLYDYMTSKDGMGLTGQDIDLDAFMAAADICDEQIASGEGVVSRYRISGTYTLTESHQTVIANILGVCDGEIYRDSEGRYGVRVGKEIAATVTLDQKHLIDVVEWSNGEGILSGYSALKPQYVDQDLGFTSQTIDPYVDAETTARYGQEVYGPEPSFGMSPSHIQTRFLSKIKIKKDNPVFRGVFRYNLHALKAIGEDFVNIDVDFEDFGVSYSGPVKVTGLTVNGGAGGVTSVDLSFSVISPDTYSRTVADEGVKPQVAEITDANGFPAIANFAAGQFDGGIVIGWEEPSNDSLLSRVEYRPTGTTEWQTATAETSASLITVSPLTGTFDVRHNWISAGDSLSDETIITGILAGATLPAPDAATLLTVTDQTGGEAQVSFTTSASSHLWKTEVYRDAELILSQSGVPSDPVLFIDAPGLGSFTYLVRSIGIDRSESDVSQAVSLT